MTHLDPRFDPTNFREVKAFKIAKAHLDESARMIARQKVLLEEAGPDSIVHVELQRSVIRLEAVYEASRTAFEGLRAARQVISATAMEAHDAALNGPVSKDEEIPTQPVRSDRVQPSWFRASKRPG